MKRFYPKLRMMLMTYAFGLASVFMINGSLQFSDEVPVNLPKVQSDSVIFVTPKRGICLASGGSHGNFTQEFIKERQLNCSAKNLVKSD